MPVISFHLQMNILFLGYYESYKILVIIRQPRHGLPEDARSTDSGCKFADSARGKYGKVMIIVTSYTKVYMLMQ